MASRLLWSKGIRQYYEAACLINKKFKNVKFDILGFIDENDDDGISLSQLLKWKMRELYDI